MIESKEEFPINFAKLYCLPQDIWKACRIYTQVRRERNRRGGHNLGDEFVIEDQLPEVVNLRQEIASPIVLLIPFVLHPMADCLRAIGGVIREIFSDPYESESDKYQRVEF